MAYKGSVTCMSQHCGPHMTCTHGQDRGRQNQSNNDKPRKTNEQYKRNIRVYVQRAREGEREREREREIEREIERERD